MIAPAAASCKSKAHTRYRGMNSIVASRRRFVPKPSHGFRPVFCRNFAVPGVSCFQGAMPELPEVEAVRRRLEPVMARKRFVRVIVRRPDLRAPFPHRFSARLTGQTVLTVHRRAKYLLVPLSSGETLVVHLGMSGSFEIDVERVEPEDARHDHVVFRMSSGAVVTFNDPRRFGFMDLLDAEALSAHPVLSTLGPEPLSAEFDASSLARACKGRKTPLKGALLDQRVVAGLGNIYAAEALHVARLSPGRQASTIATPSGAPRASARRLAAAIKQVLTDAVDRQSRSAYRSARFRAYGREAEPCRRRGCGGTIERRTQAGRSTFFCPRCQR
jgi:formamidopyrimidine-DNA glycosylase